MVWLFPLPSLPDLLAPCSSPHPFAPQRAAPLHVTGSAAPAIWSSIPIAPSLIEFEGKQGARPGERHFLTLPYDPDSSQCNVCLEN